METEDLEFYEEYLINNFPGVDRNEIKNVIQIVVNDESVSVDDRLVVMMDMLRPDLNFEGIYDEAVGVNVNTEHLRNLEMIFQDADPNYLKSICVQNNGCDFETLLDVLINEGYDLKAPINSHSTWNKLVEIFPNVDPEFLKEKANELKTETDVNNFILSNLENQFPSRDDYNTRQKAIVNISKYTTNFDVNEFLEKFPNPLEYFSNANRPKALNCDNINNEEDKKYALNFLYNFYPCLRRKDIDKVFNSSNYDLICVCDKLDTFPKAFQRPRDQLDKLQTNNLTLVQEIAYVEHRKSIRKLFKLCDENYRRAKEEAKKNNLLQTCKCCFDDELIPEECYFCKKYCVFCKSCIKLGAETLIGEGKLEFPCFANCGSDFSFPTLQMVLDSVTFAKLAQRKQIEEIEKANIDGLESCPFCDFATIPDPHDKLFFCLNKDCMKESCRKCRKVSHIPLKCEEIEYDEDVKMRTYIENKMSEALLRACWRCKRVFVKESGCNLMTCQCGALMCYVCKSAIKDYSHFGESVGRCPLWTKDLKKFHENQVKQGAQYAKKDLGVDVDPKKLKKDPEKDLSDFFK